MKLREALVSLDWAIVACASLLVLTGLAMFLTATDAHGTLSPLFIRQAAAAAIGLCLVLFCSHIPYHFLQRAVPLLYAGGVAALVTVSVTGRIIRGTVSRFEFFGFQLQPSEIMKVLIILALAWLLSRGKALTVRQFLASLALVSIPAALVISEPDIGMASLLFSLWIGVLIFLGLPWRVVGLVVLLGAIIGVGAWHWLLFDYQKARLVSFVDPGRDPLGRGYNVSQSMVALGSGEFLGRGLGHGPQSQLKFLPERHTDFILASIGEELGFIGVSVVILIYAILLWRILNIARLTRDRFGQLIAVGAFWVLLVGLFVSAGMNMGILPVTGIPLSLVSYGGSNLLTTFILLTLVESVKIHSRFARHSPPEISYIT